MKLFDYEVIYETDCEGYRAGKWDNGEPYLVRYFVWHDNKGPVKKSHIYLHHIVASDPDREHHDHPWDFYSLMLWGGYWEETSFEQIKKCKRLELAHRDFLDTDPNPSKHDKMISYPDGSVKIRRWYGAPHFLIRPAEWAHRLYLKKPAWTLVYTTKKRREWGFHALVNGAKEWIHNKIFLDWKCIPPQ